MSLLLAVFLLFVLLLSCTSLLLDLKWPASIPARTVTSWWKSSLGSVIVLCGADSHGMGVNTPFKLLWFSCSSHQTDLGIFLNLYSCKSSHFISLACSRKSFQVVEKKLVDFYLWCLCIFCAVSFLYRKKMSGKKWVLPLYPKYCVGRKLMQCLDGSILASVTFLLFFSWHRIDHVLNNNIRF